MNHTFTITKRIAKQGQNAVIIVPKELRQFLKAGTLAEIKITPLEDNNNDN